MGKMLDIIYQEDCLETFKRIPDNSVDLLVTDPPYGISFMGKEWDKVLPDKKIWVECLRVLKDGAFAFVMSIPRADCLSRMIISLEDAGFMVNFTPLYWAYASGFPKAQNIGKTVDKRLGVKPLEIKPASGVGFMKPDSIEWHQTKNQIIMPKATSPQAKALDGSYGGFQPKPAVEVIIVAMKPLSEKTYVDQALKNGKGITWLDEGSIPYESRDDIVDPKRFQMTDGGIFLASDPANTDVGLKGGRFPANLLVSDDVLNDDKVTKSTGGNQLNRQQSSRGIYGNYEKTQSPAPSGYGDSGSFSRYFDLDKWWTERIKLLPASVQKIFPFLICPKASKSEKNKGCEDLPEVGGKAGDITVRGNTNPVCQKCGGSKIDRGNGICNCALPSWQAINKTHKNLHPTVKPLKLLSYLITLGSREGDLILDPFMGSGTTALACQLSGRHYIGSEINKDYYDIAIKRCAQSVLF